MAEEKNQVENSQEVKDEELLNKVNDEIDKGVVENVQKILDKREEESNEQLDLQSESKEVEKEKSDEVTDEDKEKQPDVEDEVEDDSTKKEVDEDDESKTTKALAEQVAELNLPNRLLQAAKRNHITDEKILSWGDKAEELLEAYANASDQISARLGELGRVFKAAKLTQLPKNKEETSTLKITDSEDDSEEVKSLKDIARGLVSKVTKLEDRLTERELQSTEISAVEQDKKIDSFFDTVAKDYPEFGDSKTLSNAELVMRKNVWETADNIMIGSAQNGEPVEIEDALSQAISIYEGKNPKRVRSKIVKEVTEREKHLTNRPKSKKQATKQTKGDDAAVAAVKKYYKERGEEGW